MDRINEFQDDFLNAAVHHKLLSVKQAREIESESNNSKESKQLAIRKGYFDGRKLDILSALENPRDVVPGYELLSVLGIGGFGVVYRATQLNMSRTVALKTIPIAKLHDSRNQQRFEREARIVGQMRHPNIIAAFDFGLADERLFLSMEYIDGIDADVAISRRGPCNEFACWQIVRQVATALAYAAEHDIIHRDIKPGNLILTAPPLGHELPYGVPMVKVADFGLAFSYENQQTDDRITMADSMVGTPYYVSPEQLSAMDIDHRADIYSLGMTAWHLLDGKPPGSDASPMDVIMMKLKGDESLLKAIPESWSPETKNLLASMCAHDRDHRIADHQSLIRRIDQILALVIENSGDEVFADESIGLTFASDPKLDQSNKASNSQSSKSQSNTDADLKTVKLDQPQAFDDRDSNSYSPTMELQSDAADNRRKTNDSPDSTEQNPPNSSEINPTSKTQFGSKKVALIVLGVASFLAVAYLGAKSLGLLGGFEQAERKLTKLVTPPVFLFNGLELDPRNQSGNWEIGLDSEQATVLTGNGSKTFSCIGNDGLPMTYFRFDIGFDHFETEMIEFIVRFDQSGVAGTVIAEPETARLISESAGDFKSVKIRKTGKDNFGYHQLRIERHVNYWTAIVDGNELGRIRNTDISPAEIEVVVTGGNANFEQIRVFKFRDPSASTQLEQN